MPARSGATRYTSRVSSDASTHKRYLDYRERLVYFAKEVRSLSYEQFAVAEDEHRALETKGSARDEEEEVRFVELAKALLCD
ncbi:MAG: hypothetical protein M3O50_18600 [Myxococcota bacterium]|nr:hypothetical protein [Myxococcota bacterium]